MYDIEIRVLREIAAPGTQEIIWGAAMSAALGALKGRGLIIGSPPVLTVGGVALLKRHTIRDRTRPVPWTWWSGTGEEFYEYGPFETRQCAIDGFESDGGPIYLCEAKETFIHLSGWFDIYEWLEIARERMDDREVGSDENGDRHPLELSVEQVNDLGAAIQMTIQEWQDRQPTPQRSTMFSAIRNQEVVDA